MAKISVNEAPAGPAMDAAVAKTLQWLPYESDGVWYWKDMSDDDFPYYNYPAGGYGFIEDIKPWSPSIDIAAAWEMESALEVDQRSDYVMALFNLATTDLGAPDFYAFKKAVYWRIVHANPLDRCRAFLKANGIEEIEV